MLQVTESKYATLGELICAEFEGFEVEQYGAPMDTDISHGYDLEVCDNRRYGNMVLVRIYPYVKWSDGIYKAVYFGWSAKNHATLRKYETED